MRKSQRQSDRRRKRLTLGRSPNSIEQLEIRVMLAGDGSADPKQMQTTTKLALPLWQLYESVTAGEGIQQTALAEHLQIDNNQRVAVTLKAADVNRVAAALSSVGFVVTD